MSNISLADKWSIMTQNQQIIAENQEKVYEAGYEKGKAESTDTYYDTFWDYYQENGDRTDYQHAFSYRGWRNANFKPKYPLTNITNASVMFGRCRLTRIEVPIDLTNCTDCSNMFNNAVSLKTISEITISTKATNCTHMFASCIALTSVKILGTIACDLVMGSCPLDKESIQYVFAALSEDVTGKTVTFKGSAVDAAFKTPGSATNNGRESEEWKALKATRQTVDENGNVVSGWNIGLA